MSDLTEEAVERRLKANRPTIDEERKAFIRAFVIEHWPEQLSADTVEEVLVQAKLAWQTLQAAGC